MPKLEMLHLELQAGHLDHHLHRPKVQAVLQEHLEMS
jgi:hypothetical protein